MLRSPTTQVPSTPLIAHLMVTTSMSLLLQMSTMPGMEGNCGIPSALQMVVGNPSLEMWRLRCPITIQVLFMLLAVLAVSILLSRRAFPIVQVCVLRARQRTQNTHLYYDLGSPQATHLYAGIAPRAQ